VLSLYNSNSYQQISQIWPLTWYQ